jgi:hypothetical protein
MALSAGAMSLSWLNHLSRQQAEQLAAELGVSAEGTFEELCERLGNRWSSVKAVKMELDATAAPAMEAERLTVGCCVLCF